MVRPRCLRYRHDVTPDQYLVAPQRDFCIDQPRSRHDVRCGPTVYNFAHIGNARPAVVFDVLYRLLKRRFGRVTYARNFTDVDDKINAAAHDAGQTISSITDRYIAAYHDDMAALGVLSPDVEPRVTEHIPEITSMIEQLVNRGHAYAVEGRKMSKSLGNVLLVRDLLATAPGEAMRFALLAAHYRQPLDWSQDGLVQAKRGLDRLYGVLDNLRDAPEVGCPSGMLNDFVGALEDDLNFPRAIAELFRLAKSARHATTESNRGGHKAALREAGGLLGLLQQVPAVWLGRLGEDDFDSREIQRLVEARGVARASGDFATADQIRDKLAKCGVVVQDREEGPVWQRSG